MRLVGAPTPSPEGEAKDRNEGDPLAQSSKQGTIFFCSLSLTTQSLTTQRLWRDFGKTKPEGLEIAMTLGPPLHGPELSP